MGSLVGDDRVSLNGRSDGVVVCKMEGYLWGELLVSYGVSERSSSGGKSGEYFSGKLDGYPLGGFSDRISGGEVEGYPPVD